ncbi:hypothetical protein LOS25_17780 [Enterococcus faecium]|nr:hypothetical protein [Enterococcus faecium]
MKTSVLNRSAIEPETDSNDLTFSGSKSILSGSSASTVELDSVVLSSVATSFR